LSLVDAFTEHSKGFGDMANDCEGAAILDTATAADVTCERPVTTRRRRTFFAISVRGLLLLILVVGCVLGWIARVARLGQAQRSVVASIYQAGGWVVYDTEWDDHPNEWIGKPRWPRWIVDQMGVDYFGNVVFANLHDRGTDKLLAHVGRFKHLKQLHRPGFAVTDAGLAHLGRLSDLQFLSLDDTQVTDDGIANLMGLGRLRILKVTRTKVTDRGIAELRKSRPNLRVIR
jgi:hypothetical protein